MSEAKYTKIFINNEWRNSISGKTFPSYNPSTEEKICDIQEGDKEDVDEAVKAARAAFETSSPWRRMDASKRGKLLNKLADLMERDQQLLADLEVMDNGKPISLAFHRDVASSINCFRYHAGWCDKIHGKVVPVDGEFFAYTRYEPIGVIGQIIPWNVPLVMFSWKIAPALACGNTVVMKPSEETSLTALHMCSLIKEAGIPAGVVNVVPGYGSTVGSAISNHMDIDKIAFTGSLPVGRIVMKAAANSNLKGCKLELGGKSPCIVFPDADINAAAHICHAAVFANNGQICCSGTRTFVHADIYDEFVAISKKLAEERKIGCPTKNDTQHGPLINKRQMEQVLNYCELGAQEGATKECGGCRVGQTGYYVSPTVFSNVTDDMKIAREEIFGPVQSILKFETTEEVIKRANDTPFGLAGGVFTKDLNTAITVSNQIKAGVVWMNTYYKFASQMPFGGYKMSGNGRELGEDGIKEYCEVKSVIMNVPGMTS